MSNQVNRVRKVLGHPSIKDNPPMASYFREDWEDQEGLGTAVLSPFDMDGRLVALEVIGLMTVEELEWAARVLRAMQANQEPEVEETVELPDCLDDINRSGSSLAKHSDVMKRHRQEWNKVNDRATSYLYDDDEIGCHVNFEEIDISGDRSKVAPSCYAEGHLSLGELECLTRYYRECLYRYNKEKKEKEELQREQEVEAKMNRDLEQILEDTRSELLVKLAEHPVPNGFSRPHFYEWLFRLDFSSTGFAGNWVQVADYSHTASISILVDYSEDGVIRLAYDDPVSYAKVFAEPKMHHFKETLLAMLHPEHHQRYKDGKLFEYIPGLSDVN